jgi:hypothetical protein
MHTTICPPQAQQLLNQTDWPERLINPEGVAERSTRNSVLSRIQVRIQVSWDGV